MSNFRMATFGTITILSLQLVQIVGLGAEPGEGVYAASNDNSGPISAPVQYRDMMLIVVTDDGVAAVVFQEKDPKLINKSARYRFRFLKDAESEEITGAGIVLDTVNSTEERTIKAGQIRLGWSGGSHDRGWIYYLPEDVQVCISEASRFEDGFLKSGVQDSNGPVPKLDLKRFLKKQK